MTTAINVAPLRRSAVYKAAEVIVARGPHAREALLVAVDFGVQGTHTDKLKQAFDGGWLYLRADGLIDVTEFARNHIAAQAPKEKYIGQITPSQYRPNVFESQGLSKKNIPNRRGQRNDIPAWSVKPDGHSIKSIGGGEA